MQAKSSKKTDNRINILGVEVSSTTMDGVLIKISEICQKRSINKPFFITTVNPEFVMLAQSDPEFARIINASDLAIPDGVGLRFGGKFAQIIPGRVLVSHLAEEAKLRQTYKIYYLGGRGGVARKMADLYGGQGEAGHENIKTQITNSQINNEIIKRINKYEPDILLVAYGAPWQEKWLAANLDKIQAKVVMGVGGSFDYLVGLTKLPPEWVSKMGLEWLWRLVHQPWRISRQLKLLKFVLLLVLS